jgi:SAM-dependent methyltransferase
MNQYFQNSIKIEELESLWKFTSSTNFQREFEKSNLSFRYLSSSERELALIEVIEVLLSDLRQAGVHRLSEWERGWDENLRQFQKTGRDEALTPRYFGKNQRLRWKQEWIIPASQDMETELLGLILESIFDKYLVGTDSLVEFGCGTGRNLIRARRRFAQMKLTGLDWATSSQKILREYALRANDSLLFAENFDYFKPNQNFVLSDNDVVMTVASLEQTGKDFKLFIDYLIASKPRLIIHIEPMWEPLDTNNLMDFLSIMYFKKRNYLDGLLIYLKEQEKDRRIQLLEERRTFVGSNFIDGYSLAVWKPL